MLSGARVRNGAPDEPVEIRHINPIRVEQDELPNPQMGQLLGDMRTPAAQADDTGSQDSEDLRAPGSEEGLTSEPVVHVSQSRSSAVRQ